MWSGEEVGRMMDDLSKFFRRLFEEICIVSPLICSFGHMELHKYCLLMHNRLWHWPLLEESIYAGFSNQIRRMAMLSNFSFLAETTTVSVVRKPHFAFKNVSDSDAIIRMESRISRNVNLKIVLRSSSWWALQHLNRTNRVILVIVNLLDHSNHHVRRSFVFIFINASHFDQNWCIEVDSTFKRRSLTKFWRSWVVNAPT